MILAENEAGDKFLNFNKYNLRKIDPLVIFFSETKGKL